MTFGGLPAWPEWTFFLSRPTGENIGPLLSARSRKLSFALDSAATCTFTMPGDHPETAQVAELAVDVGVARNGVPLYRGRVGGATDTLSADVVTSAFTAVDYRGMLDRRILWSNVTRSFRGADQADIAWQMIADTQALPGGQLGITRGAAAATGVLRDRDYDSGKSLGEALAQLGQTQGGFEWEVDALRRFNLFYPQRGRQTGLVLAYGRDIVDLQYSFNPSQYANAVRFNGSQTTTADEVTVSAFDPEIGRWDAQASDPNLTLQSTVDQRAAYELATSSTPSPAFSVTLAAGVWDPTAIWVGDTVRLIVQAGRLNVDTSRRIVQIDIDLSDDGAETVVLSVAAAEAPLSTRLTSYNTRLNNLERNSGYIPDVPVGGMFDWPGSTPPQLTMWCDGSILSAASYPDLYAVIGTTFGSSGAGTFALPDCRGRLVVAAGAGTGLTSRSTGQTGGAETVALTAAAQGPPHTHTTSATSSIQSANHTHGTTLGANNNHQHFIPPTNTGTESANHGHNIGWTPQALVGGGAGTAILVGGNTVTSIETATHTHSFSVTTGNDSPDHAHVTNIQSADHNHTVTGTAASSGGGSGHENMPPWIAIGKVIKVLAPQSQ